MKAIRFAALLLCLLLLPACGAAPAGPVTVVTPLEDDVVVEQVVLSDGELDFRREWNEIAQGFYGRGVFALNCETGTDEGEMVDVSYEELTAFLQCDMIQTLKDAGVSERCIPSPEQRITSGLRLSRDIRYNRQNCTGGTIWGGVWFWVRTRPDPEQDWMKQDMRILANLEGEYIAGDINRKVWEHEPNSRVGNIPVYINSAQLSVPSIGGWEQEEFFACFTIAGYTYGVLSVDYTQQEFIEVLLAIINHYGAYPEKNHMD